MNQNEEKDPEYKDPKYEVLSVGEMRKKYYSPDQRPPLIVLDPAKVPEALHPLIPLAEKWGIGDDILRSDALERASAEEIENLEQTVERFDDELDEWLTGPEAKSRPWSQEFLTFCSLRMAADGC